MLGKNRELLNNRNAFVKLGDKNLLHEELHELFSEHGDIKSCKVSINAAHESNGYGFVCYKDENSAKKALSQPPSDKITAIVPF